MSHSPQFLTLISHLFHSRATTSPTALNIGWTASYCGGRDGGLHTDRRGRHGHELQGAGGIRATEKGNNLCVFCVLCALKDIRDDCLKYYSVSEHHYLISILHQTTNLLFNAVKRIRLGNIIEIAFNNSSVSAGTSLRSCDNVSQTGAEVEASKHRRRLCKGDQTVCIRGNL